MIHVGFCWIDEEFLYINMDVKYFLYITDLKISEVQNILTICNWSFGFIWLRSHSEAKFMNGYK